MTDPAHHDPMADDLAKKRFFMIGMTRLLGAVLVIIGMLTVNKTIALPVELGYILLIAGMAGVFALPLLLAKRWRSPKP